MASLIEDIRRAIGVEDDVLDEELPGIIETLKHALTELATAQAGELARKDAVLDRVIATAKDGLRAVQHEPPKPDIETGEIGG